MAEEIKSNKSMKFDKIQIKLASPESILEWSHGGFLIFAYISMELPVSSHDITPAPRLTTSASISLFQLILIFPAINYSPFRI